MPVPDGARKGSTLVLRKVTTILNCFTVESPEPTLQELIRRTGLPASTCQRLVTDLTLEGFLDRDGDRYRIGVALVRWATPGTLGMDVVRLVRPILNDLRDQTGESACLYARDGIFRTVIAVAPTRHVVMRPFMVGQVMPIHAGAPGKVFLAFDPDAWADLTGSSLARFTDATPTSMASLDRQRRITREQGYFAAFGERHEDVGSLAAPVFDHQGELEAVIGLGFPLQRVGPAREAELAPAVVEAGRRASAALGFRPEAQRPE